MNPDDHELSRFALTTPDDTAKTDLELRCLECDTHLCDMQVGDELNVLVGVARRHLATCDSN